MLIALTIDAKRDLPKGRSLGDKGELPRGPVAGYPIAAGSPMAINPDRIVRPRGRWTGMDDDARNE